MSVQVDEDCRESCEFLREVADASLAADDSRAPVCPDDDGGLTGSSGLCTSPRCDTHSDCLPDQMCCANDHCARSCVRPVLPLTTGQFEGRLGLLSSQIMQ